MIGGYEMKRFIAFLLVFMMVLCLTVTAFADTYNSNQGGETPPSDSPRTGSLAIVALAAVAAVSGGVFAVTSKRGK